MRHPADLCILRVLTWQPNSAGIQEVNESQTEFQMLSFVSHQVDDVAKELPEDATNAEVMAPTASLYSFKR